MIRAAAARKAAIASAPDPTTMTAAARTPGALSTPEPYVLQRALSDFYVEYELRVCIDRVEERFRILSDLHGQIQGAFNEVGVQIMSPRFETQPAQPVVVPPPRWYEPPAARPAAATPAATAALPSHPLTTGGIR